MQSAEEMPIACTLDSDTLPGRLNRIRALTDASLLSHDLQGGRLRLTYRREAIDEVRAVVRLERRCCAFLDFDVQEVGRAVVLTISAPAQAQEAAGWLYAPFLPSEGKLAQRQGCGCSSERTCG
jgi:hypothetical protein